ncbi:MAG: hypothetical protein WA082_04460 [Candidatus Moraniibacteriota bacterium]
MSESTQLDVIVELQDKFSSKTSSIEGSLARMSKVGDKLNKTFTGIGNRFSTEFGLIQRAAKIGVAGIVAAGAGIVAFGISSVKAFATAEATGARFEHSMKQIAKASDQQVASLRKQQDALSKVTRFDDEAIASGQGFLATFSLNTKQIEKLTPRLLDMAEGLRDVEGNTIGLEGASNMLGKALQMGTVGMLQKAGVTIPGTTKAMQDLFKAKFELASIEERTAMLSDLVDGNFKGQAETAGNTLAGQLVILGNTYDNLKEKVGGALAEGFAPFVQALKDFVSGDQMNAYVEQMTAKIHAWVESVGGPEGIKQKMIEFKDKIINEVIPAIITIFDTIVSVTKFVWDHRDAIVVAVLAWESFKVILTAVQVFMLLKLIPTLFATGAAFLVAYWPILLIIGALGLVAAGAYWVWKNWDNLKMAFENSPQWFKTVVSWLGTLLGAISPVIGALQKLYDVYKKISGKAGDKGASSIVKGLEGNYAATGGIIYAAGGFMQPRGTDTVPAMLTPGEMVLNAGQQARLFSQLNGASKGININITGDNYFSGEADEDRLIDKMRMMISREQEQSNWGIA